MKLFTIWKTKDGIYFVHQYESLRTRFTGGKPDTKSLNFKLHGHGSYEYKLLIKAMKELLGVETAVACPGHTVETTKIQEIADRKIIFKPKFRRPQKHNRKIKNLFSIESERVEIIQKSQVTSVLLCDDISTTGETLNIFETILRDMSGIQKVEKFVIGHKKTEAEKVFIVALVEPFDGAKNDDYGEEVELMNFDLPALLEA